MWRNFVNIICFLAMTYFTNVQLAPQLVTTKDNKCSWTKWITVPVKPDGVYEDMTKLRSRIQFCKSPTEIRCHEVGGNERPLSETEQNGECNLGDGFSCYNKNNKPNKCFEYKIAFFCTCIDGGWSDFVNGKCSVTCGNGTRTNTRKCDEPKPKNAGKLCEGNDRETKSCSGPPCPESPSGSLPSPKSSTQPTPGKINQPLEGSLANSSTKKINQPSAAPLVKATSKINQSPANHSANRTAGTVKQPSANQSTIKLKLKLRSVKYALSRTAMNVSAAANQCNWTVWINVDSSDSTGVNQTVAKLRGQLQFCELPSKAECREAVGAKRSLAATKQTAVCNEKTGFYCQNKRNLPGGCLKYQIRFFCPCGSVQKPMMTKTTNGSSVDPSVQQRVKNKTTMANRCNWTMWMNVDSPLKGDGDYEKIGDLRKQFEFCKQPLKVQCGEAGIKNRLLSQTNQKAECNLSVGLVCHSRDNRPNGCLDYKIRFLCPCENAGRIVVYTGTETRAGTNANVTLKIGYSERKNLSIPLNKSISTQHKKVTNSTILFQRYSTDTFKYKEVLQYGVIKWVIVKSTNPLGDPWKLDYIMITQNGKEVWFKCSCWVQRPMKILPSYSPPSGILQAFALLNTASGNGTVNGTKCGWTPWMNVDTPRMGGGDNESLTKLRQRGFKFCGHPSMVDCREANGTKRPLSSTNQAAVCDLISGFSCINKANGREGCLDYETRYYCPCGSSNRSPSSSTNRTDPRPTASPNQCGGWTAWINIDSPGTARGGGDIETRSRLRDKGFKICRTASTIECREADGKKRPLSSTSQSAACSLHKGFTCYNSHNLPDGCLDYETRFFCLCSKRSNERERRISYYGPKSSPWINYLYQQRQLNAQAKSQKCADFQLALKWTNPHDYADFFSIETAAKSLATAYGVNENVIVNIHLTYDDVLRFTLIFTDEANVDTAMLERMKARRLSLELGKAAANAINQATKINNCISSRRKFGYCPGNTMKVKKTLSTISSCINICIYERDCFASTFQYGECTLLRAKSKDLNTFGCVLEYANLFAKSKTWCKRSRSTFATKSNDLAVYTYSYKKMSKNNAARYCSSIGARLIDLRRGQPKTLKEYINNDPELKKFVTGSGFWIGASQSNRRRPVSAFNWDGSRRQIDSDIYVDNSNTPKSLALCLRDDRAVVEATYENTKLHALCTCNTLWQYASMRS